MGAKSTLTIFTPTYNRAYIITKLYESLKHQTSREFSWLVIDDGSADDTKEIFQRILLDDHDFPIRYERIENGGKQRAINRALQMVDSEYLFIVDSDDYLLNHAVEHILAWIEELTEEERKTLAGISGVRGRYRDGKLQPIGGEIGFETPYITATNLERKQYNLTADMAEIYRVDLLKKYPFIVEEGENFVPEAVVWDAIARDGYKLRWYREIIYVCEYLEDGLTKGSWALMKKNPVGYARLFFNNAKNATGPEERAASVLQMAAHLYIAKREDLLDKMCLELGVKVPKIKAKILAKRRLKQYKDIGV
ncbi:glycosyltransferase family 2 protein [Eubacterium oxidoreducens]|uniref:Glycosyl transferase family 2 n=1 Tax=Eubacterium oxidoreducens TaxID=1732 RepID=A0A1G6AEI3_EUBOX|nr:glycosyltransferase family A protein [Eubacterium oxidoreducens]SDB06782.1 Glycosyl transferase family 2 [Eubacterium oxidoreducens]